jgi:hypothetical protein
MKTHTLQPTKDPRLERLVDRDGNWEWYHQNEAGAYLVGVTTALSRGYPKDEGFYQFLSKHTPEERDAILSETGGRGDLVHRAIDLLLSAEGEVSIDRETQVFSRGAGQEVRLDNRAWDCLLAFQRFWQAHDPIVHVSEAPLWSVSGGYAGTADAIITLTRACEVRTCTCQPLVGKVGLWDWKTSKGIYPSYLAQVAAYARAENVAEYATPEYAAILLVGTAHKTTGGYTFEAIDRDGIRDRYARFRASLRLADIKPFDPARDVADVPDTITLTVRHPQPETAPERPAGSEHEPGADPEPEAPQEPPRRKKPATKKNTQ